MSGAREQSLIFNLILTAFFTDAWVTSPEISANLELVKDKLKKLFFLKPS
jgi:hypothetical protein